MPNRLDDLWALVFYYGELTNALHKLHGDVSPSAFEPSVAPSTYVRCTTAFRDLLRRSRPVTFDNVDEIISAAELRHAFVHDGLIPLRGLKTAVATLSAALSTARSSSEPQPSNPSRVPSSLRRGAVSVILAYALLLKALRGGRTRSSAAPITMRFLDPSSQQVLDLMKGSTVEDSLRGRLMHTPAKVTAHEIGQLRLSLMSALLVNRVNLRWDANGHVVLESV